MSQSNAAATWCDSLLCDFTGAEEGLQDPKELFNETGVPIEPFNLNREREEGHFDAGGGYIPSNYPQVKDAWLESVDGEPADTPLPAPALYRTTQLAHCDTLRAPHAAAHHDSL